MTGVILPTYPAWHSLLSQAQTRPRHVGQPTLLAAPPQQDAWSPQFSGENLESHLAKMPISIIPEKAAKYWGSKGVTIDDQSVRELFRHCAETTASEVSHGRVGNHIQGVTAAAVIGTDADGRIIRVTSPNTTFNLSTQGTFSYCAERRVLDKISDTKNATYPITVAALALTSHEMDKPEWLWRMGPCGDCLQRIIACALGDDPEIRIVPETLFFIPENHPKPRIVALTLGQLIGQLTEKQPVSAKEFLPKTLNLSTGAQKVINRFPLSQQKSLKNALKEASGHAAHSAIQNDLVNGKGMPIGSCVISSGANGQWAFDTGNNAKSNTRTQLRPLEGALYQLNTPKRNQVIAGAIVARDNGVNILDYGDFEQLAYMTKRPDVLIATVGSDDTINVKTYNEIVPYPYLTGSYGK